MSEITPSQTVGPFFAYGLAPHSRCDWKPSDIYDWKETAGANLVTPDISGTKIRIEGAVLDGDGMRRSVSTARSSSTVIRISSISSFSKANAA